MCVTEFDRLNFPTGEDTNDYDLMTLNDIINGKSTEETGEGFPGILPLVHAYLDLIECSGATRDVLNCYLDLVRLRASGELVTCAQWIRGFIVGHKDYKKDSGVCVCFRGLPSHFSRVLTRFPVDFVTRLGSFAAQLWRSHHAGDEQRPDRRLPRRV